MSLRVLQPATVAAITSGAAALAMLVRLDFAPAVFAASGGVNIDFDGETYLATGNLGGIEPVRDAVGEVSALNFSLAGVRDESIGLALGQSARGKRCRVWVAICSAETWALIEAVRLFDGELSQLPLDIKPGASSIVATAVHMGATFDRPRPFRYSDADQRAEAPGDTSGRFLVAQGAAKDVWPAASWGRQ